VRALRVLALVVGGCAGQSSDHHPDEPPGDPVARTATVAEQRELIEKRVAGPEKRKQALAVVDVAEAQVGEFKQWHEQHQRRLARLAADYDSTRADFQAAADRFNRHYGRFVRVLLELRMELRDLTTDQEWQTIASGPGPAAK